MDATPEWTTADLYDANEGEVQVLEGRLLAFGRRLRFAGRISTAKVHEDNLLVKQALSEPGHGRVLVVDGGGSLRFALVGDQLASSGRDSGWSGVVVFGSIRDSAVIEGLDFGVRCLATTPRRSTKHGFGLRDVPVSFGGVRFDPGAFLYADEDGVLVSPDSLVDLGRS